MLGQQQERATSFQNVATAILGFDGVLLTILLSADVLGSVERLSLTWYATIAAAGLLAVSATSAVVALLPRSTASTDPNVVLDQWEALHTEGSWNNANQTFAEMLLTRSPQYEGNGRLSMRLTNLRRRRRGREPAPLQPVLAATHLATVRGRWASGAGWLMASGLIFLAVALFTTAGSAASEPPFQPAAPAATAEAPRSLASAPPTAEPPLPPTPQP